MKTNGSVEQRPGTQPVEESGDAGQQRCTSCGQCARSSGGGPGTISKWIDRVKINSRTWKIQYVPKDHPEMDYDEDTQNWNLGACEIPTRTIYIEESQGIDSKLDTLIHEMAHACFATSAAPAPMKDDEELEEQCVLWFTESFFEILINAPAVVIAIMEHHAPRLSGPSSSR